MNPPPQAPGWYALALDQLKAHGDAGHRRLRDSLDRDHAEVMTALRELAALRERVLVLETTQKHHETQLVSRRAWAAVVIATGVSLGMTALRWIATGHP